MAKLNLIERGKIRLKSALISSTIKTLAKEYKSKFSLQNGECAIMGLINLGKDLEISIVAVSKNIDTIEVARVIETNKVSDLINKSLANFAEKGFLNIDQLNEIGGNNE